MAGNARFLYVGTNKDQLAVQVNKSNLAVTQFVAVSGTLTVSSITADQYGFVTVSWGSSSGPSGFETLDPFGNPNENGGGAPFTLNPTQGTLRSDLP